MFHQKALTLEEKISLIMDNQNVNDLSIRQIADKFKISKSNATNILLQSEEFLDN